MSENKSEKVEQEWRGVDGASAWHLIDRQADSWAEIGQLMEAWHMANQPPTDSESSAMLAFVLANGLPMKHEGLYRYHGVSKVVWHSTPMGAVKAAMEEMPKTVAEAFSGLPIMPATENRPRDQRRQWDKPTSYMERFRLALSRMTGAMPPIEMCQEWIDQVSVDGVDRLQEWVLVQPGTPGWAQGLVTIESAMTWADSPTEGVDHEYR